jgi:hypothetical protein
MGIPLVAEVVHLDKWCNRMVPRGLALQQLPFVITLAGDRGRWQEL